MSGVMTAIRLATLLPQRVSALVLASCVPNWTNANLTVLPARNCLVKDRDTLLAFYDFPAEHWQHVRSGNPIESTFSTVRLRTNKTRGCLSSDTALAMVFKLVKSAEPHWRRLNGTNRLGEIIDGVRFRDGEPIKTKKDHAAA